MSGTARAMVLCAGLGTRLRPLTEELPKPLVPVGDRSILAHVASRLAAAGIRDLVINVHHLPEKFATEIARLGVDVQVVHEPVIRGTAGGVKGASALFGEPPVVVWNGDILAEPPVAELVRRAGVSGICLAVVGRARGEGTAGLGADGNVVRLRGETFADEVSGADYVGVAALGAGSLRGLPDTGCLIGDVTLPALRRGARVPAVHCAGPFTDIGSLPAYAAANRDWLAARAGGGAFVHSTARVSAGVVVAASVVGAGAVVEGAGRVENCVLWPGARAAAPLRNVVVTTSGRVVEIA